MSPTARSIRRSQKRRACYLAAWVAVLLATVCVRAQVTLQLQPGRNGSTVAGSGKDGMAEPGKATASPMGSPRGIAIDDAGNIFVADPRNHVVVCITPGGVLSVIAGTGRQGYAGDGSSAINAELNAPEAVVAGAGGTLYIADTGNHRIRKLDAGGRITTVAGAGSPGDAGDGGAATTALLRHPRSLAVGSSGALYIADTGNHRVRKVDAAGVITTVAGTGTEGDEGDGSAATAATLQAPAGLAVMPDGGLLISDSAAHRLRLIRADGVIVPYDVPDFVRRPEGIAVDAGGSVYVADAASQTAFQSTADGVSAIAGTGERGTFAEGSTEVTTLDSPSAVAPQGSGDILVSDRRNHQVQRVALGRLDFGSIAAGATSPSQIITLRNGSEQHLRIIAVSLPPAFVVAPNSTCVTSPFSLQPGMRCDLAVAFAPSIQGNQSSIAQVRVSGSAPQSVLLAGVALPPGTASPSKTTLAANGSVAYLGAGLAFTATVSGRLTTLPSGNIALFDGAALLATMPLTGGTAQFDTRALAEGQHTIHAVYSGDALYAGSTSGNVSATIVSAPDFTVTLASNSYSGVASGSITIPLTLSPVHGTLNQPILLTVSGLPVGATGTFLPAVVTLGGDPHSVTLTLKMPATMVATSSQTGPLAAMVLLIPALWMRRQRSARLLGIVLFAALSSGGCGGGFRGASSSTGSGSGTFRYNASVTASTTGVLGDTLIHTATFGLVITP